MTPDGRRAFVTVASTGDVAVLERPASGGAFALQRTVHVGGQPTGIALTPDGRVALLADYRKGDLVAVDVAALEQGGGRPVLARVAVGRGAVEVAVTPDGRVAFVSDETDGTVAAVDLPGAGQAWPARAAARIHVDFYPVGLAMSPDGQRLYVTCEVGAPGGPGTLSVIGTATGAVTGRVSVGNQPVRVVLGDGGRAAWVTVRGENALEAFDARTLARLARVTGVGTSPVGLALIDGGAVAAVADSARFERPVPASTVTFVSTAAALAHRPAVVGTVSGGFFPREFALTPGGRELILTEYDSGQVVVFDVSRLPKV